MLGPEELLPQLLSLEKDGDWDRRTGWGVQNCLEPAGRRGEILVPF